MKNFKSLGRKTLLRHLFILSLTVAGTIGCSKDDGPVTEPIVNATPKEEIKLSDKKEITSFVFLLTNNAIDLNVVATIDEENKTITAAMPAGTSLLGLLPEVKLSELATIDITTAQNFDEPVEYTVTAEDGSTIVYAVSITALLTQRQILQAIKDANPGNTLGWNLDSTANLGDLDGVTLNTEGQIIELHMNGMKLIYIPTEIGQLINLAELRLFQNQLSELPTEIGQLTNLTELILSANQLTSLPPEIGQLTSLTSLHLESNKLTSLPPEIGQLTNLTKLNLRRNLLSELPTEIGRLINLTTLNLRDNLLSELSTEIMQLTNLTELNLGTNLLTELPLEIGQLNNLTELRLFQNQLSELPPEIGQLTNLTELILYGNRLSELPAEMGRLANLTSLSLTFNQLSELPPEIGFLTNLSSLFIQKNNLTTIPQAICNLREFHAPQPFISTDDNVTCSTTSQKDALISIYSANPDNTLGWGVDNYPEVEFHSNSDVKAIIMSDKNLTRIPDNIEQLTALETLNVDGNNLPSLSESLGKMNSLRVISANNNNLSTVPSAIGQLDNLSTLSLTQNPLTIIPQEVCDLQRSNGILTILTDPGEGCGL